jgi:hypothetical protein
MLSTAGKFSYRHQAVNSASMNGKKDMNFLLPILFHSLQSFFWWHFFYGIPQGSLRHNLSFAEGLI